LLEYILGIMTGVFAAVGLYKFSERYYTKKHANASKTDAEPVNILGTDDEEERLYKLNKQWQNMMEYTGVPQDE